MKHLILVGLLAILPTVLPASDNGLITKKSHYSVTETIDRLENILKQKGVNVALRWSHDQKANAVDIPLRPTELLVFGNPKLGSHLFTSKQTAGIDLPLKVLAWQDENGHVWLGYNDPAYIVQRHGINDRPEIVKKMSGILDKITTQAAN